MSDLADLVSRMQNFMQKVKMTKTPSKTPKFLTKNSVSCIKYAKTAISSQNSQKVVKFGQNWLFLRSVATFDSKNVKTGTFGPF